MLYAANIWPGRDSTAFVVSVISIIVVVITVAVVIAVITVIIVFSAHEDAYRLSQVKGRGEV